MMKHKKAFTVTKPHIEPETAEVIKMLRELKVWTREALAMRSKISAMNLSLLENGRADIGKKRAEQLARAFDVHPAIIMFPRCEALKIKKAE